MYEIEAIEAALGQLRHATYGMFGPALREDFQRQLGWQMPPVHYRLLRAVEATAPLRPTVTELGSALLIDKARASRLVTEVGAAGLVRRRPGRLDLRRREVELTEAGRTLLAEAKRLRSAFLQRALDGWGKDELKTLGALLDRFNNAVGSQWLSPDRPV